MGQPPGIGGCESHPRIKQVLMIAIVLLKMVRPEEEALRPGHLGVPRHSQASLLFNHGYQFTRGFFDPICAACNNLVWHLGQMVQPSRPWFRGSSAGSESGKNRLHERTPNTGVAGVTVYTQRDRPSTAEVAPRCRFPAAFANPARADRCPERATVPHFSPRS